MSSAVSVQLHNGTGHCYNDVEKHRLALSAFLIHVKILWQNITKFYKGKCLFPYILPFLMYRIIQDDTCIDFLQTEFGSQMKCNLKSDPTCS